MHRIIEWREDGFYMESDQRHAQIIVTALDVQDAKGEDAPGMLETCDAESDKVLGKEEATKCRSIAARTKCISQDRNELLFSAKEICRLMASPTVGGMTNR